MKVFEKYFSFWQIIFVCGFTALVFFVNTSSIKSANETFVFTAVGDLGAEADTSATLTDMASEGGDFSLIVGDLSYSELPTEQDWCDYINPFFPPNYPFQIVAGNHEDDGPDGDINNFISCLPDQLNSVGDYGKQYYFDYPETNPIMRVIQISPDLTIDGEHYDYSSGSPRYAWTENAIDSAQASGIKWIVVGAHKNCITMGQKSCEISQDLFNMVVDKKVDLFIQGHEHNYQRSKQLSLGTDCGSILVNGYNPDCVVDDGADNLYTSGNGTVVLIVGTGGKSNYDLSTQDPEAEYFASWLNVSDINGYSKFTVSENSIEISFEASVGSFSDSFSIVQPGFTPAPTPTPVPTQSVSFIAVDDATIRASSPDSVYGSDTRLEVDLSSEKNSLLKFNVVGLEGKQVIESNLYLYNTDSSSDGGSVYTVSNSWDQSTVSWNTAPAQQNFLSSFGEVNSGQWYSTEVNNVPGNGVYSYRISSSSSNGADYHSIENGTLMPYLEVVILDDGGSPAPSATPTPTPTPTPTSTPSPAHTPTPTPTPTPSPIPTPSPGGTYQFVPLDDATVRVDKPDRNYGDDPDLEVDGNPEKAYYLKFDVNGVIGNFSNSILRVYNTNSSNSGGDIRPVLDNNWLESSITWNNAPSFTSPLIDTLNRVSPGNWYEYNLTNYINQNGIYSLHVSSTQNNGADFGSKESSNPPQLIIHTQ